MRFLTLFVLTAIAISGFGQSVENIDKGLGTLKIDAKISFLKPVLVKTGASDLWGNEAQMIDDFVSGWVYNHKKAGIYKYFGLKIARIEAYFTKDDNGVETIWTFRVYCEKPTGQDAILAFADELTATNGEASTLTDEEGVIGRMDWFSEITRLSVSFGIDIETGQTHEYYIANYIRANGI